MFQPKKNKYTIPDQCPICSITTKNTHEEQDSNAKEKETIFKKECGNCHWLFTMEESLNTESFNYLLKYYKFHYEGYKKYKSKYNQAEKYLSEKENQLQILTNSLGEQLATSIQLQQNSCKEINEIRNQIEAITKNTADVKSIVELNRSNQATTKDKDNTINIKSYDDTLKDNSIASSEDRSTSSLLNANDNLSETERDIVSTYYHELDRFGKKYHVVSANITKESIDENWVDRGKAVILEEVNRGNYWIFSCDNKSYLVPCENIDIDKNTHSTTQLIFEDSNYQPKYEKIQLLKPAIVLIEPNNNRRIWRLQERGAIAFL